MTNVIESAKCAVNRLFEWATFGPYKEPRYCGDLASVSVSSRDPHLPYTLQNVPVGEGPDSTTNSER